MQDSLFAVPAIPNLTEKAILIEHRYLLTQNESWDLSGLEALS